MKYEPICKWVFQSFNGMACHNMMTRGDPPCKTPAKPENKETVDSLVFLLQYGSLHSSEQGRATVLCAVGGWECRMQRTSVKAL